MWSIGRYIAWLRRICLRQKTIVTSQLSIFLDCCCYHFYMFEMFDHWFVVQNNIIIYVQLNFICFSFRLCRYDEKLLLVNSCFNVHCSWIFKPYHICCWNANDSYWTLVSGVQQHWFPYDSPSRFTVNATEYSACMDKKSIRTAVLAFSILPCNKCRVRLALTAKLAYIITRSDRFSTVGYRTNRVRLGCVSLCKCTQIIHNTPSILSQWHSYGKT